MIAKLAAALAVLLPLAQPAGAEDSRPQPVVQPAPAQVVEPDLRGLLLSLAALAAVGVVLHERAEDREDEREEVREVRRLPGRCLVAWPTREGEVRLFDPDCLDRRFEGAAWLPLACARTVRSRGEFVTGFRPACLREEGYLVRN